MGLIELTHPGEVLHEDFLEPLGITAYRLAKDIGVSQTRVSEILHGKRDLSPETSLLLGRYFGLPDGYWLRLQSDDDLRRARRQMRQRIDSVRTLGRA